jgi:RNA polymerase sigma-70 factor, ECF subfamily
MPPIAREEVTDEVLMMRFQGGESAAFGALVKRHKTPIYNYALRIVRSPSAAEDLTQDVFVKLVQGAADFKHESKFSTWAYAVARNICIDHLRRMSYRDHASVDQPLSNEPDAPTLLDRTADRSPAAEVERRVIGQQLGQRIAHCVEALPMEQKEAFLLREIGNLQFKEIATITGVSENTVKSRMRYALERLQEALSEYEDYARALR